MNPNMVAQNRTARLVAEATTPVYSTSTPAAPKEPTFEEFLTAAEDRLCTEDFCFVCSRATDHWGEHSAGQIMAKATGHPSSLR